jgi:hypothetical protein
MDVCFVGVYQQWRFIMINSRFTLIVGLMLLSGSWFVQAETKIPGILASVLPEPATGGLAIDGIDGTEHAQLALNAYATDEASQPSEGGQGIDEDSASIYSERCNKPIILPHGMEELSDAAQQAYLESISPEIYEVLAENARITAFLDRHIDAGRLMDIEAALPELKILTTENVERFLSATEMAALADFEYEDVEDDGGAAIESCTAWERKSSVEKCSYVGHLYRCFKCTKYVRSCNSWDRVPRIMYICSRKS